MARDSSINFFTFKKGWDEFLQEHPDGVITETSYPHCGELFHALGAIYTTGLKRLLLAMMCPVPEKRFSIDQVVADPYFRGIECCASDDSMGSHTTHVNAQEDGTPQRHDKLSNQVVHNHAPPG